MTDQEIQEQAERFVNDELELKENSLHKHDCIVSFLACAKWMQFPITIILYIIFGINLIHFFLFEMIDEDKEYFYDKLIDKDF